MQKLANRWLGLILVIFCPNLWADTQIYQTTLDNGLQVIVKPDTRSPIVVSQLWYKIGASYEPLGITGISHALEHMMFEGTKSISGKEFTKNITEVGGSQNAMTDRDYTVYFETLPAEQLALAFKLEADRMQNLVMTKQRFKKELQVVKEERRMRVDDNPQGVTYERYFATAYASSPYHHLPIGWMTDLEHMKLSNLEHWYHSWYAPNNAILIVVGDVQPDAVFKLAKQYFELIPDKHIPEAMQDTEIKPLGERIVNVNVPAKLPWLLMGYLVPTIKTAKTAWEPYALTVLASILDGGPSARIPREIIRKQEIATAVNLNYDPLLRLDAQFMISGTPSQGHSLADLQMAFQAQVEKLKTSLISKDELQRVKASVIAEKTYAQDSQFYQAMMIGQFVAIGLPWQLQQQYEENIEKITPEQVQAVAKSYLTNDRLTIARLIPEVSSNNTTNAKQS